jgi:glycosyltransferase involved in cell wall biosynthesis
MVSKACIVGIYQRKLEEIAGHENVQLQVVVPPYWRDERGVTRLERMYVHGYELNVEPMVFNGSFHTHFYPFLGKRIRDFGPDILHIDEEPYNLATFLALRQARRAGCRALWFTWQNLMRRYPPPFSLFERYCLQKTDAAIAGNQTAAQVWRQKGYTGPLDIIPQFGVDPQLFEPAQTRGGRPKFVVGYAGRLVEEKGVDILLQATSELDVKVEILGSGPLRDQLYRQTERLGMGNRVEFRDPIHSGQMNTFYQGLDALVLPSRTRLNWVEQFGRVLIEAMACGVPVLGSDCGEIPHVIGDAGIVFPEGDAEKLRSGLRDLMTDDAMREDLARRARARVMEQYTQAQVAERTVSVYQRMLA